MFPHWAPGIGDQGPILSPPCGTELPTYLLSTSLKLVVGSQAHSLLGMSTRVEFENSKIILVLYLGACPP